MNSRGLRRAQVADLPGRLPCSFAGSAEFPSRPWWHNLTGPPHALGVSLMLLGSEGRWVCENHSCFYCKRNFYFLIFFSSSSAGKCSLRASPRYIYIFFKKYIVYFERAGTLLWHHTTVITQMLKLYLL